MCLLQGTYLPAHISFEDISDLQVSLPTQYNGQDQPPVGALANALGRLQASRPLRELRETVKGVTKQLPEAFQEATSKIDEYARGMISGSGSTLFEELGLYYIGPIDGHNLDNLLAVLEGETCPRTQLNRIYTWTLQVAGLPASIFQSFAANCCLRQLNQAFGGSPYLGYLSPWPVTQMMNLQGEKAFCFLHNVWILLLHVDVLSNLQR